MQRAQCCSAFADLSFTESSPLLPRDTNASDADQNNDDAHAAHGGCDNSYVFSPDDACRMYIVY